MFDVIPAIDIAGGKLVHITEAGSSPVSAFGGDPMDAARAFVEDGAAWLHVVDVDRAFSGETSIEDILVEITGLPAHVQVSGGLTRAADISPILAMGAARAVLGSAALEDQNRVGELVEEFGQRLALAIETDGEQIRPRGSSVELPLEKTMWWLTESGAARYVYVRLPGSSAVGLGGDAAAAGVELQGIRALVDATGGPVIVSGGIHGPESLAAIAAIEGVEGAIVGRALFDGTMTFADAARAARDAFA